MISKIIKKFFIVFNAPFAEFFFKAKIKLNYDKYFIKYFRKLKKLFSL